MLEKLLDLPGAAEESSFFGDGCPANMLTLQPYQQAQASLFMGPGGLGLSSAEARRMSASVGSLVMTMPEVLADLSGAIGDKVRRELPDSDLVRGTWNNVRDLRNVHGVSEKAMANVSCRKAGGTEPLEQESKVPQGHQLLTDVLPAHDAKTISSSKAQHRLQTEFVMRGTSLAGPAPRDEAPARNRRLSSREEDARLGQGPATESIGIRGYRLPKGEACRLS